MVNSVAGKCALAFLCGSLFSTILHHLWSRGREYSQAIGSTMQQQTPSLADSDDYGELDRLALAAGTDKASNFHNYTALYPKFFARYRNKAIRFLEIGILRGESAHMWEGYFPLAELHFIDLTDKSIKYRSNHSQYHFFDQTDVSALQEFVKRYGPFDIIIDDGGHFRDAPVISLKQLFPHVKPGGMYVIEDLHANYWGPEWGGAGSKQHPNPGNSTAIVFLKQLIDEVNFAGAATERANVLNVPAEVRERMSYFALHIQSMHFYNSICFINVM